MKKLVFIIAIFNIMVIFTGLVQQTVFAKQNIDEIKILFNNKKLEFDVKSYINQGKTMVPFRKIFEQFGSEVAWDSKKQTIYTKNKNTEIYLQVGSKSVWINGNETILEVAPVIIKGRVFVPLRIISDSMGADIEWKESTKTVYITYSNKVYTIGEQGTYKDFKFLISKVVKEDGKLKVYGKIGSSDKNIIMEASDSYGYRIPINVKIGNKEKEMFKIEGQVFLPTCHDFNAQSIKINFKDNNKQVIIGEYIINNK